jgi:hypothetical protein
MEKRVLVSRNAVGAMPGERGPRLRLRDTPTRKRRVRAKIAAIVFRFIDAARLVLATHLSELFGLPARYAESFHGKRISSRKIDADMAARRVRSAHLRDAGHVNTPF